MTGEYAPDHVPVLAEEVDRLLDVQPGWVVVDATVGLGGHSRRILDRLGPEGKLIAVDQDPESLRQSRQALADDRTTYVHANFRDLKRVLADLEKDAVDGLLADLGVSSPQLDDADRGFSFRRDGPLDMRMNPTAGPSAADLIAEMSERELAWIFWQYGEERKSRQVAARIVEARRRETIRTTGALAELVRQVVPRARADRRRGGGIDPATRVFQALRIAVNDELSSLEQLLEALPALIRPGGRAAIISFHSLEDRRVKHAFRDRELWRAVTKSPVTATDEEIASNPRSRSAKLRVAERLGQEEPNR